MCGIFGQINTTDKARPVEIDFEALRKRGPDDHRRLACDTDFGLVDLAFSHLRIAVDNDSAIQPYFDAKAGVYLLFNGELYNRHEAHDALTCSGLGLGTNILSEIEILAKLYELKGPDFVEFLNGIFAIAIIDIRRKQLHLYRDQSGVKPLFYHSSGKTVTFCSLSSLIAKLVKPNIEASSLFNLLIAGYPIASSSIYENIQQVPVSTRISFKLTKRGVRSEGIFPFRPYQPSVTRRSICNEDVFGLSDAIQQQSRHLFGNALFLSGGVDSSLLACELGSIGRLEKAYSIVYQGKPGGEYNRAKMLTRHFGVEHTTIEVDNELFAIGIEEMVSAMDQPVLDSSGVGLALLSRVADADGFKVVFNGAGADEVFGGYDRYYYSVKDAVRKCLGSRDKYYIEPTTSWLSNLFASNKFRSALCSYEVGILQDCSGIFIADLQSLLPDEDLFMNSVKKIVDLTKPTAMKYVGQFNSGVMKTDRRLYLPDNILLQTDNITMNWGLECRVPYLDASFLARSCDATDFLATSSAKRKKYLTDRISKFMVKDIAFEKKEGFNASQRLVSHWVDSHYKSTHFEWSDQFVRYFNLKKLNELMLNSSNSSRASQLKFKLLILNIWLKHNGH